MGQQHKRALVIVMSPITRDPRVRRQIDWLAAAGWSVDTVGPAGHHVANVTRHFSLQKSPVWQSTRLGSAIIYAILPHPAKFAVLLSRRIPAEVKSLIRAEVYDTVIFNDHHFLPWIAERAVFTPQVIARGVHVDIHEYVRPRVPRDSLWRRFAAPYYDWIRTFIGDSRFATKSTVVRGIAELYTDEFSLDHMSVIRNCPPFVDQRPSPVDPDHIRLVHHGAASTQRGIMEMIDAVRLVDARFSLTLILVGDDALTAHFAKYAADLGDRVRFAEPVEMSHIAAAINPYDVEVMFFPPVSKSLELALPNKLFEAIQARLASLIGESPMMQEVVSHYDIGEVARGWTSESLAAAINSLSAERIVAMKHNTERAAKEISAESERIAFFHSINRSAV